MKYRPISSDLFVKNRKKFCKAMKPNSLAVFNSNDQYPIGADSVLPFQQSRDLFYLSGIDQPETILILYPDAGDKRLREILFVTETNEYIATWEGHKFTEEEAFKISGIRTVYRIDDFERIFYSIMTQADAVYFNTNEHYRQRVETETREDRFIKWCKGKFLAHKYERSNPILQRIRGVKEPEEISLMQTACDITEKGFRRLLGFVSPGVLEYEIEAEIAYEFIRNGSKGFAYQPIIASGSNSNILHYIENNKPCKSGDLILIDAAAEYANYSSDMTRTIPVNGKFSTRQKTVYEAVLRVKDEATKMLTSGVLWDEHHREVCEIMTSELLGLGLIDKADIQNETPQNPAYKKYFMHGTCHSIGLDTHDYGDIRSPLKAGMIFTVEPGIYIPREGFGIRLEDNVVIQNQGDPINLMKNIPILPEEIENLMNT